MALTGGFLVLNRTKKDSSHSLIKPARIRFDGNFSGVKNKFTF